MEKKIILERLQATINNLQLLNPTRFKYDDFVSEYNRLEPCGSVCCVAGWYPVWFPESEIYYDVPKSDDEYTKSFGTILKGPLEDPAHEEILSPADTVRMALEKYHGLNPSVIDNLFFGGFEDSGSPLVFKTSVMISELQKVDPLSLVDMGGGYLEYSPTRGIDSNLEQVISYFKGMHYLIENDIIDYGIREDN